MQLPSTKRTSILRATTVEVLALVGDAGATPFIQYSIFSGDTEVRVAAYKAAAILRIQLSRDEMRLGLRDPIWQVRAHAATVVGRAQMTDMARELASQLGDPSWWVRLNAARALRELGNPGLRLLESVAEHHEDSYARGMALRILTEDPAYSALSELRETLANTGHGAEQLESGDQLATTEGDN
jgi:HEAT repeat protein